MQTGSIRLDWALLKMIHPILLVLSNNSRYRFPVPRSVIVEKKIGQREGLGRMGREEGYAVGSAGLDTTVA